MCAHQEPLPYLCGHELAVGLEAEAQGPVDDRAEEERDLMVLTFVMVLTFLY